MNISSPKARQRAIQKNRNPFVLIWDLIRPAWGFLALAFTANLVAAIFEGSSIGLLAVGLQVLGASPEQTLAATYGAFGQWLESLALGRAPLFLSLVLLAVGFQVLRSLLQFLGEVSAAILHTRVQADAYKRIFSRVMHLSFPAASRYKLGDLTDYLSHTNYLHEIISELNVLLRSVLLVAVYVALMLWISWPMTAVAAVLAGAMTWALRKAISRVGQHARRFTEKTVTLSERATEFLSAIRSLHTFSAQERSTQTVGRLAQEGMRSRCLASIWGSTVEPLTDILTVLGAGALLLGGFFVLGSGTQAALPSLLAFLLALHRMAPRLRSIYSARTTLARFGPSIGRLNQILQQPEDTRAAESGRDFSGLKGKVAFDRVTLTYHPDEPAAVSGLTFEMPRGSMTALVGTSGAGKSTVADLLLRLYEPTSGQIVVDGQPLAALSSHAWRQHLGVVSQQPFLFHASIRDNIAFGKPGATEEEILAAAQAAHADCFIKELADGYSTVIGDRGYRLSGGQRQRIALARALVRQPQLLILDEATSALDSESERLIQEALEAERRRRTLLIIAHRLSTVAQADQILVLDRGRLVEQGSHETLLVRGGIYARLWQLQSEKAAQAPQPLEAGA